MKLLSNYAQVFNALADKSRLKILLYLYVNNERCVCNIDSYFDINQKCHLQFENYLDIYLRK